MHFSVIYSIDVPEDESLRRYLPPDETLWDRTEGDERYEYGYLEGPWTCGQHRKFAAILTRNQFERFIRAVGLYPEDVETGGSIGVPGFGFGWAPAISFRADEPDAILDAYVTPIPDHGKPAGTPEGSERQWQRIRRAILRQYH